MLVLLTATFCGSTGPAFAQITKMLYTDSDKNNIGIGTTTPQGAFVVTNGNVGVGTWAPGQTLDVIGNIRASGTISGTSGANGWSTGTGTVYTTTSSDNVGIGTTGPGSLLELDAAKVQASSLTTGGIWIRNTTAAWDNSTSYSMLTMRDQSNVNLAGIRAVKAGSGAVWGLAFDGYNAGATSDLMTILGNGNVGIGTTGPGVKLEVAGDILAGPANRIGFRYSAGDMGPYNYITANGSSPLTLVGGLFSGTPTTEAIRFETASVGSAKMSILNNGNVGIGATVPTAILDVQGVSTGTYGIFLEPTYTSATNFGAGVEVRPTLNLSGTGTNAGFQVDSVLNLTGSGVVNHAMVAQAAFLSEAITQGDDTITDAATVWIQGAQTATVSGGNYALKVDSGTVALGTGNVGIGTTTPQAAFVVTNGNVGIGTWTASARMQVVGQYNSVRFNNGNSGATLTIDWNNGNVEMTTLTANCTFTLSNPVAGGRYIIELKQDGTGSRTVTWPAAVKWSGGTAPTLTTTASQTDIITLYYNGTNYAGASTLNYGL